MIRRSLIALSIVACVACSSDPASSGGGDDGGGTTSGGDDGGSTTTTSSGDDAGGPSSDPFAEPRANCVKIINDYRATLSLPPYKEWTAEGTCADGQAKSDSQSGTAHGAFGKCTESSKHGHYINMSSTSYTEVACGFYQTSDGSWWAVQDFR